MKKKIPPNSTFLILFLCYFSLTLSGQDQINSTRQDSASYYFEEGLKWSSQLPDSAKLYLLKASRYFLEEKNWEFYLKSRLVLNNIYYNQGDLLMVKKLAEENFAFAQEKLSNNHSLLSIATNNKAVTYSEFGDYISARSSYHDAYKMLSEQENSSCHLKVTFLFGLAVNSSKIGDFFQAKKYFKKGIMDLINCDLYNEEEERRKEFLADFHFELGVISRKLYDFNESQEFLIKAIDYFNSVKKSSSIKRKLISCHYEFVHSLILDGKMLEADRYLEDLKIDLEGDLYINRPQVFYQLKAKIESLNKNYTEAIYFYELAHNKREEYFTGRNSHVKLAESLTEIGEENLKCKKFTSSIGYYQEACSKIFQKHNTSTPYPLLAVPILDGKAQAHLGRYQKTHNQADLDTAYWCYLTADSLVDAARDRLQNEGSKLFFSQKSRPIYERAIRFCIMMHKETGEQTYLEKAFYFSERNKATLLFQSLQDAGAKLAAGLPDSLLTKERDLKVDIAFYQNKIFEAEQQPSASDSLRLIEWRQILFDREEAYRSLTKSLEKQYADYYQLKYDHRIMGVADVQARLGKGQLFLEFFEGDSSIYLFAIGKKDIQLHELRRNSAFDQQLTQLLRSLQQPQKGLKGLQAFAQPAHALYQQLLVPVLAGRDARHLIIVPDGQLSYLPFELLLRAAAELSDLDDRQAERQFRHLPYLFRDTEMRYAWSATLLLANPYRPKARLNQVAAFAPAYEGQWFLAHNQPQAEAVASLMGGRAFTGPEADKLTFLQNAPDYRVLHLAMHGEPDLYSPLRARLLFAGEDTAEAGSLFAYELYNLKLNAQMAVLAACESGYGKLEQSEGIYSLARAFRFAGCPSVVSSLWKADGQATMALMQAFYAELEKGAAKSSALQAARIAYLETASNAQLHPYYWANFVVIGDDEAIADGWRWGWWVAVGLLLVGLVLGYRFVKRREEGTQIYAD